MKNKKMTPIRLLSIGYFISIVLGTILLVLPISSKNYPVVSISSFFDHLVDALFTATSATCVTGLIPFDTLTNWTIFGQIVIIVLIQLGGLGFMTIITLIFMMFKKNISMYNRTILMQSAGSYTISEVTKLMKRIFLGTLIFESLGTIILTFVFLKNMNFPQALYNGIFHSISAFCNAGFDVLGSSLINYSDNSILLITIMSLIIIGGLGFIVWSDLIDARFRFKKLQLHSKVVLVFSLVLIILPAILFFIFEFTSFGQVGNYKDLDLSLWDKIINSLFLSVSPRTAGFNALNLEQLTSSGKFLTIILMFIGGNSGSTAGGVKVTTFIIVIASLISSARSNDKVVMFKRQIPSKVVKQSGSLFIAYMIMVVVATILISSLESFTFEQVLFEVVSAVGTVGLTLGVSAAASIPTQLILILLMYAGRLGALALFSVFIKEKNEYILEEPKGKIIVG